MLRANGIIVSPMSIRKSETIALTLACQYCYIYTALNA